MVGVRVLMEPILSLHYVAEIPLSLRYTPLKSSFLLTPLRSGLVPLAPVGHAWIATRPNGSRRVLSPTEPETKRVMMEGIVTRKAPAKGATF